MNGPLYRWYVLALLALTYAFSVMDRQILSILLEDLRAEFTLTDTQLGLLSGIAFALFYSTLGIPIARLADRYHRVNIVSTAVAVWSVVTACCGLVTSFMQLFLARIGVGIGEAGGGPPSHSLVSDYFEPERRSIAISVYSLGTSVGGLFGLVLGGFVAEHYGWRMAFIVAGAPGIALALLVKLTVREPVRGRYDRGRGRPPAEVLSFVETAQSLWNNLVYRRVLIAHTLAVFVGYAFFSWLAALYLRQFELSQSGVGALIGTMNLVCGVPGLLLGGYLADRLGSSDPRWRVRLPALALCIALPAYFSALWTSSVVAASTLFGMGIFAYQVSHGPGLAVVQLVVQPEARAQAAAYIFFFSNLVGLGMGPLLVGYLSDISAQRFGDASLAFCAEYSDACPYSGRLLVLACRRTDGARDGQGCVGWITIAGRKPDMNDGGGKLCRCGDFLTPSMLGFTTRNLAHGLIDVITRAPPRPVRAMEYVKVNAEAGNPRDVLAKLDDFATNVRWLMSIGPNKDKVIAEAKSKLSGKVRILELGAYAGYLVDLHG